MTIFSPENLTDEEFWALQDEYAYIDFVLSQHNAIVRTQIEELTQIATGYQKLYGQHT